MVVGNAAGPYLPVVADANQLTVEREKPFVCSLHRGFVFASGLEAQYIAAEAALHGSASTAAALTLINTRRTAGGQGAYAGGTDTLSVVTELLNQRARDFWLEGKKLGDLRRNPSVALASVLTDPSGNPFYVPSTTLPSFGSTFCAPIPPQETNANPNFKP